MEYTAEQKAVKAKVQGLIENNNHTEAMIECTKYLGATKTQEILEHIKAIQDIEGEIPCHLYEYRYQIYKQLVAKAPIVRWFM